MEKLTNDQVVAVKALCDAHSGFEYFCHKLSDSRKQNIGVFIQEDKNSIVHFGKELRRVQRELGFNLYHDIRALVVYKTGVDIGE